MIIPIRLRYSNAYLLQSHHKSILIDTGCKGQHSHILNTLEQYQIRKEEIALIVHTHIHPDHCGSTLELASLLGVPTMIHIHEYESLLSGKAKGLIAQGWEGHILKRFVLNLGITYFEPDHFMREDRLSLKPFGVNATALLTPGHTAGSISIIDHDSQEAIVGDLLMGGYLFNTFRPSQPRLHYFIQDARLLKWSINQLLAHPVSRWHPGHGGPLSAIKLRQGLSHFLT